MKKCKNYYCVDHDRAEENWCKTYCKIKDCHLQAEIEEVGFEQWLKDYKASRWEDSNEL